MSNEFIQAVTLAVIGSGAFATLVTAVINAISHRKGRYKVIEDKLSSIEAKLVTNEKDALRTQLLILISDYPEEQQEIMTIAQYYFGKLKGDWYASSLFNRWIEQHGITEPIWFSEK